MLLQVTDEDVALRAPADFAILCPRDQRLASGLDGSILSSDRWVLRSDSNDFNAQGLEPGQVVQLLGPASAFKPPCDLLAVQAVEPGGLRLRRKGQPEANGQLPAPVGGLNGVEFLVATLAPQIAAARDEINDRLGLEDPIRESKAGAGPLREAIVLTVLARLYYAYSRDPGPSPDYLAAKAIRHEADREILIGRLADQLDAGPPPPPRVPCRSSASGSLAEPD